MIDTQAYGQVINYYDFIIYVVFLFWFSIANLPPHTKEAIFLGGHFLGGQFSRRPFL